MTSGEFTNAHPALARFFHPVALSSEVGQEPVAIRLAGQGWALARFGGVVAAFADACPHRRARLFRRVLADAVSGLPEGPERARGLVGDHAGSSPRTAAWVSGSST